MEGDGSLLVVSVGHVVAKAVEEFRGVGGARFVNLLGSWQREHRRQAHKALEKVLKLQIAKPDLGAVAIVVGRPYARPLVDLQAKRGQGIEGDRRR